MKALKWASVASSALAILATLFFLYAYIFGANENFFEAGMLTFILALPLTMLAAFLVIEE